MQAFFICERMNLQNTPIVIQLPGSKSESNRVLMLSAYSKGLVKGIGYSEANDTQILQDLLSGPDREEYSAGDAGTAFRFICTYLALKGKPCLLTGSERMQERPIAPLVDALRQIGSTIEYERKQGFPPLRIGTFQDKTNLVKIRGDVSSQFISSLMMAAPTLPNGLNLEIEGPVSSFPYLQMTWNLLQKAGIQGDFGKEKIQIPSQTFRKMEWKIESDWSSAGYFLSWLVLAPTDRKFIFPGLLLPSQQGDSFLASFMEQFGIRTRCTNQGLEAWRDSAAENPNPTSRLQLDLGPFPDQAQTLLCLFAILGIEARISGLQSLVIKETNRLLALKLEFRKLGVDLRIDEKNGTCFLPGKQAIQMVPAPRFTTYGDHRMAMALSLFENLGPVEYDDPGVVKKSFPDFWVQLKKMKIGLNRQTGQTS